MRVVGLGEQAIQGPRTEMQDVTVTATAFDGTEYFGIFDGHSKDGLRAAITASGVVQRVADMQFEMHHDVINRANRVRQALSRINDTLSVPVQIMGGSTATVGILYDNEIAVAYLGDSEAFFYPDQDVAISLTEPHTVKNKAEVERVKRLGFPIVDDYFGNRIQVSRAIGDFDCGFVSNDAQIKVLTLPSAGTLVVASDGVWGKNHYYVEQLVRSMPSSPDYLARELVNEFAVPNYDNASAIVARIE